MLRALCTVLCLVLFPWLVQEADLRRLVSADAWAAYESGRAAEVWGCTCTCLLQQRSIGTDFAISSDILALFPDMPTLPLSVYFLCPGAPAPPGPPPAPLPGQCGARAHTHGSGYGEKGQASRQAGRQASSCLYNSNIYDSNIYDSNI
jgi:hypothetical protein